MCAQGVSCDRPKDEYEYVESEESNAPGENAMHYDCDEYQAKIWDKALSNPAAMKFVEKTMETVKEGATDEVCSDTSRSLLDFLKVMNDSPNAHYTVGMFMKMIAVIMREIDTSETSDQFKETGKVISQLIGNQGVQDLTLKTINRSIKLLENPKTRERLFRTLKIIEKALRPSDSEMMVKNGLNQVKGMANAPTQIVKGTLGRVGNMFQGFK